MRARAGRLAGPSVSDLPGFFSDWRADGRRLAFDFFEPGGDEQIATATLTVATYAPSRLARASTRCPPGRRTAPASSSTSRQTRPEHAWLPHPPVDDARGRQARPVTCRVKNRGSTSSPKLLAERSLDRLRPTAHREQRRPTGCGVPRHRPRRHRLGRSPPGARRASHLAARQPLDHLQHARGDHRRDAPGRRPPSRILRGDPGAGRPQAVVLARWHAILSMCENQGLLVEPHADHDEDICVMDADGSDVTT